MTSQGSASGRFTRAINHCELVRGAALLEQPEDTGRTGARNVVEAHDPILLPAQATRYRRRRSVVVQIGMLNEGALHAQLKEWYRRPGDLLEQTAASFVVDLVRGDLLVEIQTGGFAPCGVSKLRSAANQPIRNFD